jgi:hypothetical protein
MQDEIAYAFTNAKDHVIIACEYLEDLMTEYMNSSLDNNVKEARISAVNANPGSSTQVESVDPCSLSSLKRIPRD